MTIALVKNWLWMLYRYSGPWQAARLRARLVSQYGLKSGMRHYRQLPPGDLHPADRAVVSDQQFFIKKKAKLGPIFKFRTRPQLCIAITDLETAGRFAATNPGCLAASHSKLQPVFPVGHLRGMQGSVHRRYRKIFVRAMRAELIDACEADSRTILRQELAELVSMADGGPVEKAAIIGSTRKMTTRLLLRLLLGARPGSTLGTTLISLYEQFSTGYAPPEEYSDKRQAFEAIRAAVMGQLQSPAGPDAHCVLKNLSDLGEVDETVIGNLIQMVEGGRFDLFSLFRWILYYLARTPGVADDIWRSGADPLSSPDAALARAVVLETLRCNQSEAVQRQLSRDVHFEGMFFPSGSLVRICLWEAHKEEAFFACPMNFEPSRFVARQHSAKQFAPFGVDQHRCLASDFVVELATLFVEEVCRYDLQASTDGPPFRGPYHWEPAQAFGIRLLPRRVCREPAPAMPAS